MAARYILIVTMPGGDAESSYSLRIWSQEFNRFKAAKEASEFISQQSGLTAILVNDSEGRE